jgi:succinyl-CoA synthetase beta subunit
VRLNLASDEAVESAFDEVMENARSKSPSASILGVTVQKMVSGLEVAAGVAKDPQFGHVLMFGMGGVDIELIRDTTFRLIPIDAVDAQEMIRDIRGYSTLKGDRGPGVDLESLRTMLIKISHLIVAHPQIEGMDLNPIMASPSGSVVADARIVVSLGEGRDAG